ncbi:MAG: MFS transporter, partial [Bacteroidia bacterium]|nr:MFS transporter [Bacteroidia bacterium]
LFSVVRIPSLKSLGLTPEEITSEGIFLINMQMIGMLIGGILWGILGDKKGRLSVLFGSILMYSLANIGNAFVTNVPQYAILRLIAGIGLAGELGAGITLVSELMPKETRGIGSTIIATIGLLGAVVAALTAKQFSWEIAYIVGGVMGLALLVLRIGVTESGMFATMKEDIDVRKGDFLYLFSDKTRLFKYLICIAIGLPTWFVVGILITFCKEFSISMHLPFEANPGKAVLYCYSGLAVGDLASGILSQLMKSRKKVLWLYLFLALVFSVYYLKMGQVSENTFYWICFLLGIGVGYWAIFVTIASEQFGTNIRATVTTSVPNFVRGAVVPMTIAFEFLREPLGIISSALIVGIMAISFASIALFFMQETFGKDLNYTE